MYTLKYIKPSETEHGYTSIICEIGVEIGYFIPMKSKFRIIGHNYYLEIKINDTVLTNGYFSNRKKVVTAISDFFNEFSL